MMNWRKEKENRMIKFVNGDEWENEKGMKAIIKRKWWGGLVKGKGGTAGTRKGRNRGEGPEGISVRNDLLSNYYSKTVNIRVSGKSRWKGTEWEERGRKSCVTKLWIKTN